MKWAPDPELVAAETSRGWDRHQAEATVMFQAMKRKVPQFGAGFEWTRRFNLALADAFISLGAAMESRRTGNRRNMAYWLTMAAYARRSAAIQAKMARDAGEQRCAGTP